MATDSSTLAWQIPWTEETGRLQSMGSLGVRHNWATSLSLFTFMHWRRKWQPTPVFLPGESQGRRSMVGCRLWGRTELDTIGHDWSDAAAPAAAVPVKSITTTGLRGERERKSRRIYRTSQNIIIFFFFFFIWVTAVRVLSLTVSHSSSHLPRMPSNTVLIFGPTVGVAQILIWPYSSLFSPPMFTAIRTSTFSFVGALNDLLYIP